jgi:hypothetical protein
MRKELLVHYLETGTYTYAGNYKDYFQGLPDNVEELGKLICSQVIHRITLKEGNKNANRNQIYGDMNNFPWYRMRCEDDIFLTAAAMAAELFRLDQRGFIMDRPVENKIVVCCRNVSVLMTAILKAKGIPSRSRAGFAPYLKKGESRDHWINQYWDESQNRWITFDADAFWDEEDTGFNQYNIPEHKFDWAAETWLKIRNQYIDGSRFVYADAYGTNSLKAVVRYLFYDFHAIMNNELTFSFQPCFIDNKFEKLEEEDFIEIDNLAKLLLQPDKNYKELLWIWNTKKKYRAINSPLVGDSDNDCERSKK